MSSIPKSTRRDFMQAAGAAVAAPYIITSAALGNDERPPASDRIVMGGIGIGNMGRGRPGRLPRPQGRAVRGRVRRARGCPREAKGQRRQALQQQRLPGLQRFPRAAGPRRHRRGAHRHARPLARDHGDRGLPQRQGRLLPEARNAHAARRPADGRRGAPLRPRGFRRQPARAGRLSRSIVDQCWGGELGTIKSINVNVGPLPQLCNLPAEDDVRRTSTGTCGSARPPGRRTTRSAAAAASTSTAQAGGRSSTIPAAA